MSVQITSNGTYTGSMPSNTFVLPNPVTISAGDVLDSYTRHSVSDAGIRNSNQDGVAKLRFNYRWTLLDAVQYETFMEMLEALKWGNHWAVLQDNFIPDSKKGNIQQKETIFQTQVLKNATDLDASLWPKRPINKYGIITSGAQVGQRRKIIAYSATQVQVSPVFAGAVAVDDTFIIGTPVLLLPGQWMTIPRNNNRFDFALSFVEKGD
ncbi:MAG: hypothetical protein L0Y74_08415 [candidate division Zixibacteria bacterium]|nr:hypothetical protein [candidate division Zixibacteria bacterium]